MKTKAYFLLLLLYVFTACEQESIPQPTAQTCSPQDFSGHPNHARYMEALQTYAQKNQAPGAILLLKKQEEPLWIGAVGKSNLEHQTALTVCSQIRTGSISKTLVATLVMKLKEQGLISFEDKLADLLPGISNNIQGAGQVDIRHMLTHTSGIFDPTNNSISYKLDLVNNPKRIAAMTDEQFLEKYVYGTTIDFRPGARYSYSNINYLLLKMIIERKSGKSLQAVMEELIFKPLQLNQTYIDKRNDSQVARGYSDFYGDGLLMDVTHLDRSEGDGRGYAGLVTTVQELFVFSEALFGGKIISQASLEEMIAYPLLENGVSEYGFAIDTWHSTMGTGRGNNGTSAGVEINWFYFPERKSTFILFKNSGNGSHKDFLDKLIME